MKRNIFGIPTEAVKLLLPLRGIVICYRTLRERLDRDYAPVFDLNPENKTGSYACVYPGQCTREKFIWLVATRIQKVWMNDETVGLVMRLEAQPGLAPILADNLEENGCDSDKLLTALRML